MTGTCLICRNFGVVEQHHWTGQSFDPQSTIRICRGCHVAEHQAWRAAGINRVPLALHARAARLAWLFGSLADRGEPALFDVPTLRGVHVVSLRILEEVTP
jgi:hypothetical protein